MITCQVPMSNIKCQISGVKYNMSSTGVRYQVSNQVSSNNMSIYHAKDVKITITRYETMIAKHEVTQKMYSPKFTRKYRKIPEHHKHVHATSP